MLREEYNATILMVTHDVFTASYCDKIMFMKDGKIETTINKECESRQTFFSNILDIMSKLDKDNSYVL